jgi:hypothetical protein
MVSWRGQPWAPLESQRRLSRESRASPFFPRRFVQVAFVARQVDEVGVGLSFMVRPTAVLSNLANIVFWTKYEYFALRTLSKRALKLPVLHRQGSAVDAARISDVINSGFQKRLVRAPIAKLRPAQRVEKPNTRFWCDGGPK